MELDPKVLEFTLKAAGIQPDYIDVVTSGIKEYHRVAIGASNLVTHDLYADTVSHLSRAVKERDEARRLAAENGKMIAALRQAGETLIRSIDMDKEILRIIEATTSALDHVLQFARIPRDQRVFFNNILHRNRKLIRESKDANQSPK